ncbi:outer membrane protein [Paracoccus seriniphilus]|uniref:Outer membrane immunogenic protein n=1 Tax=Paracoccus seriniphilus TaxID=184748 RepID=A0A239PYG6_9RHOB|nr:outer membrane beta-barrel protein [Paracoccus seriniphilus]WCR14109.1 porin family protein [Paracoccus seriniphilus]SNT75016.1 outer membrane immunogenic protein [Paracoccus seriniphilus]
MFNNLTTPVVFAGALVAATGVASAGGYTVPVVAEPVIAPVAAPVADWAGAYGGLSAGYVFGGDDRVGIHDPSDALLATPGSADLSGATYGVHLGYRWQREFRGRQIVYGPELAYEGSSADDSFDTGSASAESQLDNLIALRFKTGILNEAQNTMFYGIIGAMRGEFDYQVEGAGMDYDDSFDTNAWTVGLGVERMINDRVSVFGEWEYRDFGRTTLTDAAGYSTEATPEHHVVKMGVNFSF